MGQWIKFLSQMHEDMIRIPRDHIRNVAAGNTLPSQCSCEDGKRRREDPCKLLGLIACVQYLMGSKTQCCLLTSILPQRYDHHADRLASRNESKTLFLTEALQKMVLSFFAFYMWVIFVCMYMYTPCGCNVCGAQKRTIDPQKLELQLVVRHHVDTGK